MNVRPWIATVVLVAAFGVLSVVPASAELEPPQRSAWGLAEPETATNAVGRFSSLGWSVEEHGQHMYVGGKFQNVTDGDTTVNQPNFARFSLTGVWDDTFTPSAAEPVLSIASGADNTLLLGGEIGSYNGTDRGPVIRIDADTGEIVDGWGLKLTGGTGVVREVTIEPDGWAYAVGSFSDARYGGTVTPVSNIVRFDPETGAPDTSWTPTFNGGLWDVSVSRTNNSVYVAGWYTEAAGVETPGAVGISTTDDTQVTWGSFPGNHPNNRLGWFKQYGIEATENGHVWVAGEQHSVWIHDESNNYELLKNHITNCHIDLQNGSCTRRGGEFQEIERVGDRIYISCHCWGHIASASGPDPIPYNRLDRLEPGAAQITGTVSGIVAFDVDTGERDQSFDPYMAGDLGGFGMAGAADGCLWLTGGFNAVGNPADGPRTPGRDLVRLCDGGNTGSVGAPASCAATLRDGQVEVTWATVEGANNYIVYRSIDGGDRFWRAAAAAPPFIDNPRAGDLAYFVAAKAPGGTLSAQTECSFEDLTEALVAPAACAAVINGDNIDVTWDAAAGAGDYIVYRSVDDGPAHWRGRVAALAFTDSNRPGALTYYVSSKSASGERSEQTECELDVPDEQGPQPVASCTATAGDNDDVVVAWPDTPGIDRYVIYRTFDGGPRFWRGATDAPASEFNDSLRDGEIEYFVAAKLGSTFSEVVTCTPKV